MKSVFSQKKNLKHRSILLSGAFLIFGNAVATFSQTNDTTVIYQTLDNVIIQNQRLQIPFSKQNRNITILDRKTIEALPVQSLDELLSYVSGIDVRRRGEMGAQADISINGGTFDQTLILLNGMKVIDPQTGHNLMVLPISLESIERIEILKGPAAAAYGVNAINGAINIVTRQSDKTGVMAHVTGGSNFVRDSSTNHFYGGMDIGVAGNIKLKNSTHFFALSTTQSNGYRHNTDLDLKKFLYSNHINLGKHSLDMQFGFADNAFGANGFYAPPVDKDAIERTKTVFAAAKGTFQINDNWFMRPSLNYRYSDDHFVLFKLNPTAYENKHYANIVDAEWNNTIHTKYGTVGFGLEYRTNNIHSNSLGDRVRNDAGIYANYSLDFVKKLLINVGAYANYNAQYKFDIMPTLDLGYEIIDHLRVYANFGTGMRQPTYTDLYYSGPMNIGNPNLMPEKSWQAEGGIKYEGRKIRATAQYFFRNTSNFIDWVRDSLTAPWTTLNYQQIKLNGVSVTADYVILPKTTDSKVDLSIHGSYTYLDPKFTKTNNAFSHYALENLRHQVVARIDFGFLKYFKLSVTERYMSRMNYKDYGLWAVRLSAQLKGFEIFVDGDNLTNVQFVEAGAAPLVGSWYSVGVKWQGWK